MIVPMEPKTREERIRIAVAVAHVRGRHEIQELADIMGCSRVTMGGFVGGSARGVKILDTAEAWCKKNGFWPWGDNGEDVSRGQPVPLSILEITASELRNLAAILESPEYDNTAKVEIVFKRLDMLRCSEKDIRRRLSEGE